MDRQMFLEAWECSFRGERRNARSRSFVRDLDALLAAEREGCAKVADDFYKCEKDHDDCGERRASKKIAEAIRSKNKNR